MSYYIVYSYEIHMGFTIPTKYIRGIYNNIEHAEQRQHDVCGLEAKRGENRSLYGNGVITFINVIPIGDCNVQLFTT